MAFARILGMRELLQIVDSPGRSGWMTSRLFSVGSRCDQIVKKISAGGMGEGYLTA
jgi:hypothetical protein